MCCSWEFPAHGNISLENKNTIPMLVDNYPLHSFLDLKHMFGCQCWEYNKSHFLSLMWLWHYDSQAILISNGYWSLVLGWTWIGWCMHNSMWLHSFSSKWPLETPFTFILIIWVPFDVSFLCLSFHHCRQRNPKGEF